MNGTDVNGRARVHPIVGVLREQGRSQTWLAFKIGRSHAYVNRTLNGLHPAIPAFRAACAAVLGMDEDDLFHQGDASAGPRTGATRREGTAVVGALSTAAPSLSTPQEAPLRPSA